MILTETNHCTGSFFLCRRFSLLRCHPCSGTFNVPEYTYYRVFNFLFIPAEEERLLVSSLLICQNPCTEMKKKAKIHPPRHSSDHPIQKLAFLFSITGETGESITHLCDSVKRLKKEYQRSASFYLLDEKGKHTQSLSEMLPADSGLTVIQVSNMVLPALNDDVDFVVLMEAGGIFRDINFNVFFQDENFLPGKGETCSLYFKDQLPGTAECLLFDRETVQYFQELPASDKETFRANTLWYLRHLRLKSRKIITSLDNPYQTSTPAHSGWFAIRPALKRWYNWNFTRALREGRSKNRFVFLKESPLLRPLFIMAALLTIVLLPLISYQAGISGDEEKHWLQAEKVYDYFASGGQDTLALNDTKYKLNFYGQSFDLLTYAFIKTFHIEKIYETRHVLNGLMGALTMVATALLVRLLLGNAAGLLSLFLMFFSPRFLGHAMNNPLDIPFALGYIFTLLQIVRFLKRLPVFSVRIAILIMLGIALTISIRIGGLILIPYLFLFCSLYVLFNKWPWPFLKKGYTSFVKKGLIYLVAISHRFIYPQHPAMALRSEGPAQKSFYFAGDDVEHFRCAEGHV